MVFTVTADGMTLNVALDTVMAGFRFPSVRLEDIPFCAIGTAVLKGIAVNAAREEVGFLFFLAMDESSGLDSDVFTKVKVPSLFIGLLLLKDPSCVLVMRKMGT